MRKFLNLFFVVMGMLAAMPTHAQVTYTMSPASAIHISGTSTLSDWVVKSQKVSGDMVFTPSAKKVKANAFQTGTIKDAKAILEVINIKSEKGETMDNKMYAALKSDSHPQITFHLTQPIEVLKAPAKLTANGDVALAGITRPMKFDLNLTQTGDTFHLQGLRSLKLSDFEIEPPSAMFGQIETGDEIVVEFNLFFEK